MEQDQGSIQQSQQAVGNLAAENRDVVKEHRDNGDNVENGGRPGGSELNSF
jgi:hypothetical protein